MRACVATGALTQSRPVKTDYYNIVNCGPRRAGRLLEFAHAIRKAFLTPCKRCCYGAKQMQQQSRRYLLLFVAVAALGYFFYKFRNSITLPGFRWSMVGQSLRHANLFLLLLGI